MTLRIGVHFNCQVEGLAASLGALLPDADIVFFHMGRHLPPPAQAERAALLSACDHVITIGTPPEFGRLSTDALRRTARNLLVLPGFAFNGFHPDQCYIHDQGRELPSVTGGYQSRIAAAAYLGGLSVADTARLYNPLVFARLGYFAAYAEQCQLLAESWSRFGMDAHALIADWRQRGCFAHTINHPKVFVLLDLARAACARMGVAPAHPDVDPDTLPDNLARGPMHPVFPDIAAALGIAPEGCFSGGTTSDGVRLIHSPEEFVRESFRTFSQASEAALLAAPGVADAVPALGFARARRPAARQAAGADMALLSFHGTILKPGMAPGHLQHVAVAEAAPPFVTMDAALPQAGRQTHGALAGATARRATLQALLHVARDGSYLCAEREGGVAGFSRGAAGDWESFLPVSKAEIATLHAILRSDWLDLAAGEIVPRALIRLTDSFTLVFGRWSIDLLQDFPRPIQSDADRPAEIHLLLDGESARFRAVTPAAETTAQGILPASVSLENGRRLVLAGAPAWLPPPVTGSDADRAWLYEAARDPWPLNGRAQAAEAVLRRERDQSIWGEGPAMPVPGVSVRFCEPGQHSPFAWMEAALRLHVLAPLAPPGAAFLLPDGVPEASVQAWRLLGFNALRFHRLPPGPCMAADLIWLDQRGCAGMPAEAMAALRARLGAPPTPDVKLFWPDGIAPGLEAMLLAEGFQTMPFETASLARQMGLLARAAWVIAASRRSMPVFCPPGARVLELAQAGPWRGEDWIFAVKQGAMHGVLPCEATQAGLMPDPSRLAALLRVMAARV